VAKVGTSKPDRTISLKRLQCVVEYKDHTSESVEFEIAAARRFWMKLVCQLHASASFFRSKIYSVDRVLKTL
jgi:hypothetical protein